MRDSREETEECETMNMFLVRFRKLHRAVLEKHMKPNTLHILLSCHVSDKNHQQLEWTINIQNLVMQFHPFFLKLFLVMWRHTVAISYSTDLLISRYSPGGRCQGLEAFIGSSLLIFLQIMN